MAEFCRQCAEKYDIGGYTKAPSGREQSELCEGCGWTWVDEDGYCLSAEHEHVLCGARHLGTYPRGPQGLQGDPP